MISQTTLSLITLKNKIYVGSQREVIVIDS